MGDFIYEPDIGLYLHVVFTVVYGYAVIFTRLIVLHYEHWHQHTMTCHDIALMGREYDGEHCGSVLSAP